MSGISQKINLFVAGKLGKSTGIYNLSLSEPTVALKKSLGVKLHGDVS